LTDPPTLICIKHNGDEKPEDGEFLGDASKMTIDLLIALHFIAEAWRQITPTTIENCFRKCGFPSDGEHIDVSNDVLNEQERDNWCSLKPSGVEFDEYVSYDAGVSVCDIQSVDRVMQDDLCGRRRRRRWRRRRRRSILRTK